MREPGETSFVNGVVRQSYEYLKEHGILSRSAPAHADVY